MSEDGVLKSAILLMSIGEEEAAEVLKYLGPKEVQKIGMAMATLENISREQIRAAPTCRYGNPPRSAPRWAWARILIYAVS